MKIRPVLVTGGVGVRSAKIRGTNPSRSQSPGIRQHQPVCFNSLFKLRGTASWGGVAWGVEIEVKGREAMSVCVLE